MQKQEKSLKTIIDSHMADCMDLLELANVQPQLKNQIRFRIFAVRDQIRDFYEGGGNR